MAIITIMHYIFLASIVFDVAVGVWFVKNSWQSRTTLIHLYYVTLSCIVLWEVATYISFFIQRSAQFNFVFNASTFSFGLVGVFSITYFVWHFFGKKYLPKALMYLFFCLTILLATLAYIPGLLVGQKVFVTASKLFYLTNAPLTIPFYFFILSQFIILLILLFVGYRRADGKKRQDSKFIVIGFGSAVGSGIITYVAVPLLAKSFFETSNVVALSIVAQQIVGGVVVSVLSVSIAYAILRHRIFAISYRIKRSVAQFLLYSLFFCAIVIIIFFITTSGAELLSDLQAVAVLVIFLFLLFPLQRWLTNCFHKLFPQQFMDLYTLTSQDQALINSIPSTERLLRAPISRFIQHLPLERLVIYLYDPRSVCFVSIYPKTHEKLAVDVPWIKALRLQLPHDAINQAGKKLQCVKILPVLSGEHLLAIVGFGERIDQTDFSQSDKELIEQFIRFLSHILGDYLRLQYQAYTVIDHLPIERS